MELEKRLTWKVWDKHASVSNIVAAPVQNGIDFGVAHVRIWSVQPFGCLWGPRQGIIGTASRKTVIANANDARLFVDNAGPGGRGRILGALGAQEGNRHEIVVPRKVLVSLWSHLLGVNVVVGLF